MVDKKCLSCNFNCADHPEKKRYPGGKDVAPAVTRKTCPKKGYTQGSSVRNEKDTCLPRSKCSACNLDCSLLTGNRKSVFSSKHCPQQLIETGCAANLSQAIQFVKEDIAREISPYHNSCQRG